MPASVSSVLGPFSGLLVLMASIHPAADAQIELAHAGKARAVIVAEEWVPEATAAFRQLSVFSGEEEDLLGETFEGTIGRVHRDPGLDEGGGCLCRLPWR